MSEVEDTLKRIQAHKGVIGTIVVNAEGFGLGALLPVKGSLNASADQDFVDTVWGRVEAVIAAKGGPATYSSIPIRTTLDNSTTVQYAGLLHQLTMKARSTVRDIDPQNDLTFLRIRSKKHEIMVAPDKEYLLIVIQNPSE